MKVLVTGADGQLGYELVQVLAPSSEVIACNRSRLDLCDSAALSRTVREIRPDVICNAAAYTAVDRAETEVAIAEQVNGRAPGVLAEEARRAGALMVHYSTDYVFDGSSTAPYSEQDDTHPLNAYGATKLQGEQAVAAAGGRHLILRTSWVYAPRGKNFVLTMLRLAAEREELRVVSDQHGTPTPARLIAATTAELITRHADAGGIFHLTASGSTNWFEFACAIVERTRGWRERQPRMTAISSAEYPTPARRPANSRLSSAKLGQLLGHALQPWSEGLQQCLDTLARERA